MGLPLQRRAGLKKPLPWRTCHANSSYLVLVPRGDGQHGEPLGSLGGPGAIQQQTHPRQRKRRSLVLVANRTFRPTSHKSVGYHRVVSYGPPRLDWSVHSRRALTSKRCSARMKHCVTRAFCFGCFGLVPRRWLRARKEQTTGTASGTNLQLCLRAFFILSLVLLPRRFRGRVRSIIFPKDISGVGPISARIRRETY